MQYTSLHGNVACWFSKMLSLSTKKSNIWLSQMKYHVEIQHKRGEGKRICSFHQWKVCNPMNSDNLYYVEKMKDKCSTSLCACPLNSSITASGAYKTMHSQKYGPRSNILRTSKIWKSYYLQTIHKHCCYYSQLQISKTSERPHTHTGVNCHFDLL